MELPVTTEIARRAEAMSLDAAETARFSRHLLLPEVGEAGQRRLKAARVLLIGTGGLGSPASLYLAAAGVGTLGLVEFDTVDASNLQRQILYTEADAGRPKLVAAAARLKALHPRLNVEDHDGRIDETNAARLVASYDIVIDGTDNFPTRYLVNDACVLARKPYVYGSIFRFDGQASVFYAPHGPCYRCLFPAPPPPGQVPSCAEGGVLGVLPGLVGTVQATEAIKLILGRGTSLLGRLMTLDALALRFDEFRLQKDDACAVCGNHPTITSAKLSAASCAVPVDAPVGPDSLLAPRDLAAWREAGRPHTLIDVRSASEAAICRIDGALLIPLPELARRLGEIPRGVPVVIHCKSGARSAQAVKTLAAAGLPGAKSLAGGILAWIEAVDPRLVRY